MGKKAFITACLIFLIVLTINFPAKVSAMECGLSCCIAGAAEGIGAGGRGFNVGLQYEYMKMETILQGTDEKSPNEILATKGNMYKVPTEMIMQKLTANVAYGLNEKASFLASIPYIKNDMDMRMNMVMGTKDMTMDTIEGMGDITLMGFYKLFADRNIAPTERITIGAGIKMPTGEYEERTKSGSLVHMMMQRGSGSWDPVLLINGMKAFGKTYLLGTVTYQFTTDNDRGYEIGDKLSIDITAKHRLTDLFNAWLALNYIHADSDKTDGSIDAQTGKVNYQDSMMSMIDNVANTGLESYFLTPGIEFKPSAGSSWSFKASAKIPVYQDVNGVQQVTDDWYLINANYRF